MRNLLMAVGAALLPLSAQAGCTAQSSATRPHLIELYSSEGCSSCPPAEAWLRSVHNDAYAVALEFHVDYWDSLGWRDRFANARYTARQQALAARTGGAGAYTPEVILDGREWRDWYRRPEVPVATSKATMNLSVEAGTPLRVHVNTVLIDVIEPATYGSYVALIEDGLTTEVGAGENRGAHLRHDHVVRSFIGPLVHGAGEIRIPDGVDRSHATIVAFAQDLLGGDVAQVVMLPLAQCSP